MKEIFITIPDAPMFEQKRTCNRCGHRYVLYLYDEEKRIYQNTVCPKCKQKAKKPAYRGALIASRVSPTLKECENPLCTDENGLPYLFWGYKQEKFCCKKCAICAYNIKLKKKRKHFKHIIFINNFFPDEIDIVYHHLNDFFVMSIPTKIHASVGGHNHREKMKKWITFFYGFDVDSCFNG